MLSNALFHLEIEISSKIVDFHRFFHFNAKLDSGTISLVTGILHNMRSLFSIPVAVFLSTFSIELFAVRSSLLFLLVLRQFLRIPEHTAGLWEPDISFF